MIKNQELTYQQLLNHNFSPNLRVRDEYVVIKVGSSSLLDKEGRLDPGAFAGIANQIKVLNDEGKRSLVISSGAVAAGKAELSGRLNGSVESKQALAAVGNHLVVEHWKQALKKHELKVASLLLSEDDIFRKTEIIQTPLEILMQGGIIPITNANDAVERLEIEQLRLGADNDKLAGLMGRLIQAKLLFLLTGADGVLDVNGDTIKRIDDDFDIETVKDNGKSLIGSGGIFSKIEVARSFAVNGRVAYIANAHEIDAIPRILGGEQLGTRVENMDLR